MLPYMIKFALNDGQPNLPPARGFRSSRYVSTGYLSIHRFGVAFYSTEAPTAADFLANEKWTKQMRDYFVVMDKNKNGLWSQEDWTIWIDNLKKTVEMGATEEAKLRAVHGKFGAKLGATGPGVQLTQDQFVKAVAGFSSKKEENIALINEVNQAWFDVVDTNDDGTISLSEYTKILEACNMTADVAKIVFDSIDKNNNGKIEMEELLAVSHKFWFSLEPVLEGAVQ